MIARYASLPWFRWRAWTVLALVLCTTGLTVLPTAAAFADSTSWVGTVELKAPTSTVSANDPSTWVAVAASVSTAGPYAVSVYDNQGRRQCYDTSSSGCTAWIGVPNNASITYTAYVAQDYPVDHVPTQDVRAVSNPFTITNPTVDLDQEVASLAAAATGLQDPCIEMFPVAPPSNDSSLNQAQEACESARLSGTDWKQILRRILDTFGTGAVINAAVASHDGGTRLGAPPRLDPPSPDAPPAPPIPLAQPPAFDPIFLGGGAQRLLNRSRVTSPDYGYQPDADPEGTARKVYAQCVRLATTAASGVKPGDCDSMPIFAPGSDVEQAAQHDFDVIARTPSSLRLSALTGKEKDDTGVRRDWYNKPAFTTVCPSPRPYDSQGNATECDEYPFYSSAEGGPTADGGLIPEQLRLIRADQNGGQGTLLRGFYSRCGITAASAGSPGRRYLVVPLPQQDAVPTTSYCAPGRP